MIQFYKTYLKFLIYICIWRIIYIIIILTDSKSNPLRHGTVGISLAYAGFAPLDNKVGEKDLFEVTRYK